MMDIQAALGIHQLEELEEFINRRTQLANRYLSILADWLELTLPKSPAYEHRHPWHLFCVLINPAKAEMDRNMFMKKMQENNIGTGLHYNAAHLYEFYQTKFGFREGDFPIAEDFCSRIVSLPLFPNLTQSEQDRVIHTMQRVFQK